MIKVDFGDEFDWGKPEASGENGGNCFACTRKGKHAAPVANGMIGIRDTKVGASMTLWANPADFNAFKNAVL